MANVLCRDSKYLDNLSLMGMSHMDGLGVGQKWKVKPNYYWALPGSLVISRAWALRFFRRCTDHV